MSATSGYLLWSPDYNSDPFNGGAPAGPANVFFYSTNASFSPPSNTGTFPFGSDTTPVGGVMNTSKALDDPAALLLATDLVQDARCISACMNMVYTGKMMDSSGQVAFIEDLPLSALLELDPFVSVPKSETSVDALFNWTTRTTRLGTDKVEVKFRPDATSARFRSSEASPIIVDTPGTTGSVVAVPAQTLQPTFFGIAWRGLDTSTSPKFSFELTKCLEWRASPISGLTHAPPKAINAGPVVQPAIQFLDRKFGQGWSSGIKESVMSNVGRIAQTAFTGASNYLANQGIKYVSSEFAALGGASALALL
jgi:hypothetical protein